MVKLNALFFLATALVAGCTKPNNATCADDYCQDETLPFCDKDGFLEGTENACIAVSCAPGELVACHTPTEAYYCNATGNDINISPCANGCDETMGGCIDEIIVEEECIANTVTCDGDVVKRCNADGVLSVEACDVSCISDPEPHCAYLEPKYLPDICDVPATGHVDFGPFDTNIDSQCTGGIVTQVDGPEICVVRAATISVPAGVSAKVSGDRVLALVADSEVLIEGVLDVSADAQVSGPGGQFKPQADAGATHEGAGGGGGAVRGASGASCTVAGGTNNGGIPEDPLQGFLAGGMRGGKSGGGGAGGAATLIACRGAVRVTGLLDANGGGGAGGIWRAQMPITTLPGAGGGSGGSIVLQGLVVQMTGAAYANGGGGGNGAGRSPGGSAGADGKRSVLAPVVPATPDGEGVGGTGGTFNNPPRNGGPPASGTCVTLSLQPGGGGGAVGRMAALVPAGRVPSLLPTESSPAFDDPGSVEVR